MAAAWLQTFFFLGSNIIWYSMSSQMPTELMRHRMFLLLSLCLIWAVSATCTVPFRHFACLIVPIWVITWFAFHYLILQLMTVPVVVWPVIICGGAIHNHLMTDQRSWERFKAVQELEAERSLLRSTQAALRGMLSSVFDASGLCDRDGMVHICTPQLQQLLRGSQDELVGSFLPAFAATAQEKTRFQAFLQQAADSTMQRAVTIQASLVVCRASEQARPVDMATSEVAGSANNIKRKAFDAKCYAIVVPSGGTFWTAQAGAGPVKGRDLVFVGLQVQSAVPGSVKHVQFADGQVDSQIADYELNEQQESFLPDALIAQAAFPKSVNYDVSSLSVSNTDPAEVATEASFDLTLSSRSWRTREDKQHVAVQTTCQYDIAIETREEGTQTESARRSQLPPTIPGGSMPSLAARRTSRSSSSSSRSGRLGHARPLQGVAPTSEPMITSFAETPLEICSMTFLWAMKHWNVPRQPSTCCPFHTVLRVAKRAMKQIDERKRTCEPIWSPLLSWQCTKCSCLQTDVQYCSMCHEPKPSEMVERQIDFEDEDSQKCHFQYPPGGEAC
eukprot:gnl/TRDRNA2_/TRDRNA2_171503_c0_seq1.p1 gnl/TRDRNA2_/TRDRNA2_171503_c0~~gnl/TRDRNA2_/TRDRNA2_171503_c0_seq1.p1  ORF type:complete len:595 (+),score=53.57 gnl/TRDRNA2_/TRDRNA2_171503_c0_seq1:106-1785(+)